MELATKKLNYQLKELRRKLKGDLLAWSVIVMYMIKVAIFQICCPFWKFTRHFTWVCQIRVLAFLWEQINLFVMQLYLALYIDRYVVINCLLLIPRVNNREESIELPYTASKMIASSLSSYHSKFTLTIKVTIEYF